ncbi:MAG: hypothetical protein GY859_35040, partial [Desulfobacterales bacterium]|nr:hypothetical protein [Desulfobacterales bacterium]
LEDNKTLTLGVRGPEAMIFDRWENAHEYAANDVVTDIEGNLWTTAAGGVSDGTGVADDDGVTWDEYWGTIWKAGEDYPVGSIVIDPSHQDAIYKGTLYIALEGGTASGTGVFDDRNGIGGTWDPHHLTHIDIFPVTEDGFVYGACQDAIDAFQYAGMDPDLVPEWVNNTDYGMGSLVRDGETTSLYKALTAGTSSGTSVSDDAGVNWVQVETNINQGQLKQDIEDCMGYVNGGSGSAFMPAFNHAIHYCWYNAKHGDWQPGAGPIQSIKSACEAVYAETDPWFITADSRGFACMGLYDDTKAWSEQTDGFVGRCWNPGAEAEKVCHVYNKDGSCKKWKWVIPDGADPPGWGSDECIETALRAYCGEVKTPRVVDPSDQTSSANEYWNIPAVLIDTGVVAQLGEPLDALEGAVLHPVDQDDPEGLIQEYAKDLHIGVMLFNHDGSKTECPDAADQEPGALYDCANDENRDGAKIAVDIGPTNDATHEQNLVDAINDSKATSWTPLAEAMFNAIGYYTQDETTRLDPDDFSSLPVNAEDPDVFPTVRDCQGNHVLMITEGASTADANTIVETLAEAHGDDEAADPGADTNSCNDVLKGSTLLDDLTYYAHNEDIFGSGLESGFPNIKTHIVVAGAPRTAGSGECRPDVLLENAAENGGTSLYMAPTPAELANALEAGFESIRAGAAAGSAASVISASRGGEGAVYQAIFWPEITPTGYDPVAWTGEVHALLVDAYGRLYEDTNANRSLDAGDERVVIYYDTIARLSRACNGSLVDGACTGVSKSLDEVKYLWSASEWLAGITDEDIVLNRPTYESNQKKRYIYTWNDLNNDGAVDAATEWLPFVAGQFDGYDAAYFGDPASRAPVSWDFGVQTSAEMNRIINWVRGRDSGDDPANTPGAADYYTMRPRKIPTPSNYSLGEDLTTVTLRLGDVVHSTPISVGRPAEGYHLMYRDESYGTFYDKYKDRRHVVYFGGNDGMLHAVNGGFYNTDQKRFMLTENGEAEADAPLLGAELWAYAPYNLIPHLKCLTDNNYTHKYYVDLKPRIFDVQIWATSGDDEHPGGWGTILVGGMRFGGAKVRPGLLDLDVDNVADHPNDPREFTSAYFVLDVTNPENPPVLLGELTRSTTDPDLTDMGYTTAICTAVPMKEGDSAAWYLVFGSGPTTLEGWSDQTARAAVFPLSELVKANPAAFRIPNASPPAAGVDEGGVYQLTDENGADVDNAFVSDLITVDYELEANYKADAVYFGTVEGAGTEDASWGNWKGRLYRLVTRDVDGNGVQESSEPADWTPAVLFNPQQPVTAAPTIGADGEHFRVFFGNGRFFSAEEKTDASQRAYYGIKEPTDCSGEFTWGTMAFDGTHGSNGGVPGGQGLLRVDQIRVRQSAQIDGATLTCEGCSLPAGVTDLEELTAYIVGTGCKSDDPTGTDGWYLNFEDARERNLGQAALLGGLLNFTTYVPSDDICTPEGISWLYAVYFLTGTAWHESVFDASPIGTGEPGETPIPDGVDGSGNVVANKNIGRGLATTPNLHVGRSSGSSAFIQTSTGTIVEIAQPNLPIKTSKSGRTSWIELTE